MSKIRLAAALAAAFLASQAAAQVVFYEGEGFHGASFTIDRATANFERYGFNDRASSVIVERGDWEVCVDANFNGRCVMLRPGQYPSLASMGLNNTISSIRPVGGGPPPANVAPPPPPPAYGYYPRPDERLYQATVTYVRAVVGPPEQRCWVEQHQVQTASQPNVPAAILGGILGGVLGHQIGGGRGKDVATAVGAVGGAAVGANVNRTGGGTAYQDVQRCTSVPNSGPPQYYDVSYNFRGVEYRTQLTFMPGPTITVNERGEPRV